MLPLARGGMRARLAGGAQDLARVQALRALCWPGETPDPLDTQAGHLMIEGRDGRLLAAMRVAVAGSGAALHDCYAARYYDLSNLQATEGPLIEPGRFSLAPGAANWEVLRLTWAALARLVLQMGAGHLFGCASFPGTDWHPHREALALLAGHQGPDALRPGPRAPERVAYPALTGAVTDHKAALAGLPPLLRFYLTLGGWVSDHAVVDRQLNTLHVFTCVEVAKMPKARQVSLRALAVD
ncbi:GNAT family N-acetyltransferase [Xinfangfangia sp. D13-10-4-6]|nr:GNAT family N-acetyltransferase [Pseudogemmobacter hezensis]